jgi:hypothetical protein
MRLIRRNDLWQVFQICGDYPVTRLKPLQFETIMNRKQSNFPIILPRARSKNDT